MLDVSYVLRLFCAALLSTWQAHRSRLVVDRMRQEFETLLEVCAKIPPFWSPACCNLSTQTF